MNGRVTITYCSACRFVLRATWLAQELLFTFDDVLEELSLRPGTGGVFEVSVDGTVVWSRDTEGRFPDAKELKQRIRDRLDPTRSLGHSDTCRAGPGAAAPLDPKESQS